MAKLMYRCPRTGVSVDIWLADEVTPVNADTYEHVMCASCAHIHFINKTTGKALGEGQVGRSTNASVVIDSRLLESSVESVRVP